MTRVRILSLLAATYIIGATATYIWLTDTAHHDLPNTNPPLDVITYGAALWPATLTLAAQEGP